MHSNTLSTGFDDVKVYERVVKSTVWILATSPKGKSSGTGSLISATQGLILTNYHVIDGAAEVIVFFPDFKDNKPVQETEHYVNNAARLGIRGRVIAGASDPARDLALIQLDKTPPGALRLPLASASPSTGQQILSIGSSGALSGTLWRYTPGKVRGVVEDSAVRTANGVSVRVRTVETDSPVNPGDSGGPVVNGRGEMVAVVRAYYVNQRSVSLFIDVQEVLNYLSRLKPALQRAGFKLEDFTPEVRETLGGSGNELKTSAAVAIGRIKPEKKDPEAAVAIRALTGALKDKDASVRASAVVALGEFQDQAATVAFEMANILADPEIDIAVVVDGLAKLGENAVPIFSKMIIERYPKRVQLGVVLALGKMGPLARRAAPNLYDCSRQNRDPEVRKAARDAVKQVDRSK
jgi:S1-C subfamily serine protease